LPHTLKHPTSTPVNPPPPHSQAYHISVGNRMFKINADQLPVDFFNSPHSSFDGDIEMADAPSMRSKNSARYKEVPQGVVATLPSESPPHTPSSE
jgi:hypothetical protein